MTISVNLPDGSVAQFPDGTPKETIQTALQQKFAPVTDAGLSAQTSAAQQARWNQEPQPGSTLSNIPIIGDALKGFYDTSNAFQSGATQGMTLGFGDELLAGAQTPIQAGVEAMQGKGLDLGRSYNTAWQNELGDVRKAAETNPLAAGAGELAGSLLLGGALSKGGLSLTSKAAVAGKPWAVAGAGALEGGLYGGAYGLGKGETAEQRGQGAMTGAATGAVLGALVPTVVNAIGNKVSSTVNRKAVDAAIANAPSAADLKAASSALFQQVDNSGVTIDTPKFAQFVGDLARKAKADRINPTLDPKATAAYQELIGALADVQAGQPMTLSQLHTLRQIAQKAAVSTEGRDAMFANRIVDGLDDFIQQPGAAVFPANQLGNGATTGPNELLKAISTWSQSRKVGLIEEAMYKASIQKSGLENGLRLQFGSLLRNPKTRRLFTAQEIKAIEEVANGTTQSNLITLLGKFGFGANGAGNMLGGTIGTGIGATLGGAVGGPLGSAIGAGATGLGATALRNLAEKIGAKNAERVARIVATQGVPAYSPMSNPFTQLGGAVGGQIGSNNRPQITVGGGGGYAL